MKSALDYPLVQRTFSFYSHFYSHFYSQFYSLFYSPFTPTY